MGIVTGDHHCYTSSKGSPQKWLGVRFVWQLGGEMSQASTTRGSQQVRARAGSPCRREEEEEQQQGVRHEHYGGRALTLFLLVVLGMLFSSCSSAPSGTLFLDEGHHKKELQQARSSSSTEQPAASAAGEREEVLLDAYHKLPLSFVPNGGHIDEEAVRYYAQGAGYGFYFTPEQAMLSFAKGEQRGAALGLSFLGANPHVAIEPHRHLGGTVNYLVGDDPDKWHTGLASYGEILYRGLWPGIDMVVSGKGGKLKYEFLVQPGASVKDIQLAYRGAQSLSVGRGGELLVETPLGVLEDTAPRSYQTIEGKRVAIDSRYTLEKEGSSEGYGFSVGAGYDPRYPLVIDPGLAYSTFLGGKFGAQGFDIAVSRRGEVYVTGITFSSDFPTTPGAFDRSYSDNSPIGPDPFVSKLNADGSALLYSTYLGGRGGDGSSGIALNWRGQAYVIGNTFSKSYPTTRGAFDRSYNGFLDAFVSKLKADGSALVYSTFLGERT
jgi:hypothetical protein